MHSDVGSDPDSPVRPVEVTRDSDEHLATTVVYALSEALGCHPNDLPVELNDAVDPDSLERVFEERGGRERGPGRLIFEIAGCEVTVTSAGRVTIDSAEAVGGVGTDAELERGEGTADD
ncbi:HalOD1 output domain-containing protein [Halopelagius fulvigenes]|uniref:HalOD1 output domain-containing protein n=1 Tax=Halopelagius fulvigenes TaxID=1198324 RepID=A0ABD5TUK2_9EURY